MSINRYLCRILVAVLVICMLFENTAGYASAEAKNEEELSATYVSDIKTFYAESAEEAKKYCEDEGYIFNPANLNEGTEREMGIYLGYKTTKDPGDAITDLTLLDMKNSHYSEMTYQEYMDAHIGEYADAASKIMLLVNDFRKKYEAGSPNAIAAYDSLNTFYIDESKSHTDQSNLMGEYILKSADLTFFEKYMQRGNSQILSSIVNTLGTAVTDYEKDKSDWVQRSKVSAVPELYKQADSAEKNQYDTWYKDPAKNLIKAISSFAETYKKAKELHDKYGDTFGYEAKEDIGKDSDIAEIMEKDPNCRIPEYVNALATYDILNGYVYQEAGEEVQTEAAELDGEAESTVRYREKKTLADVFLGIAADDNLSSHPESVYGFIDGMTAAQRAVLDVCGLNVLAKSLYQNESYSKDRSSIMAEINKKLVDAGFKDGKIYLYQGVDKSLYSKQVVQTSERIEAINAGTALTDSINEKARKEASNLTIALQIIDISLMFLSGVFMIVQAIVGVSLWAVGMAAFSMAGIALAASLTGYMIGYALLGALCCAMFVLSIVVMVLSIAYLIYTILDMCGVFEPSTLIDYSKIPEIMFHVRQNSKGSYSVRYDSAHSNMNARLAYDIYMRRSYAEDSEEYQQYLKDRDKRAKDIEIGANIFLKKYMNENASDMAAFEGRHDRWLALYYTKAPACGAPIKVHPEKGIVVTKKEDSNTPPGAKAVTLVNGSKAADINSVNVNDRKATPLYMFAVTDPDNLDLEANVNLETETKAGQYISRVRLVHAAKREDAINSLKAEKFTDIIDVNLTPYDGFTFIGYQYGSKSGALTDLRVSSVGTDPIEFGDASYGRAGLPESGTTPDGMSLYATTNKNAGTPITKISVETKRLPLGSGAEPVCLFSGGNAVDFKHKWSDNYNFSVVDYEHLTSRESVEILQDDPDDGYYIYFWPETQYKAKDEDDKPPYVSGFSYFLSASESGKDNRFGTHAQFMQKFAESNGYELIMRNGYPMNMMSDEARQMNPIGSWQDCEGGALGHDWRYDIYHWMTYNTVSNFSDKALAAFDTLKRIRDKETQRTSMYFGVSYTYNPYRAITGVTGMITPYTETTKSIRFTGLKTPAGTYRTSDLSIQGNSVSQAGISYGYFNYTNMPISMYHPYGVWQKYDEPWLSGGNHEILTHYLLMGGPTDGREPIKRSDLKFVQSKDSGQIDGYSPVRDIRTPADTAHPMNLALDTVNIGSEYLYMYLKNSAGGRTGSSDGNHNSYKKKHYVAAMFCGTGKTADEAMNSLYASMQASWAGLSQAFPDIPKKPLITELDEVITTDLSAETPWYQEYTRDTSRVDPSDDEWVYGNDSANRRWGHEQYSSNWQAASGTRYASDKLPDDMEGLGDYAYIGVVRTSYAEETATVTEKQEDGTEKTSKVNVSPVYGVLKYYTNEDSAPGVLSVGDVKCTKAGGPVKSKEGSYFVYYSTNSATASFTAPVTDIDISDEAFTNGFNTGFSCSEKDRVDHALPNYSELRMRTDEFKYIHTKYDMDDLPYIEAVYLGIGDNKKAAYADLIGTTNANAAADVNLNYNSFSKKWIAVGYRRTSEAEHAIRDLFLYSGNDPQEKISIDGYTISTTKKQGKTTTTAKAGEIPYTLIKHNLKKGSEILSLNEGSGGKGLYLYYTRGKRYAYDKDAGAELTPIRNIAFGYGDITPEFASAEQLAEVYGATVYGMKIFDIEAYRDPAWEYVLGIEEASADMYKVDSSNGRVMSLNYGQLPARGGAGRHTADRRVLMYVDHAAVQGSPEYKIRDNASLSGAGYYSATSRFGVLAQGN